MCNPSKINKSPFNVNVMVIDEDAIALHTTMEILTTLNYKGTIYLSVAFFFLYFIHSS